MISRNEFMLFGIDMFRPLIEKIKIAQLERFPNWNDFSIFLPFSVNVADKTKHVSSPFVLSYLVFHEMLIYDGNSDKPNLIDKDDRDVGLDNIYISYYENLLRQFCISNHHVQSHYDTFYNHYD